MARLHISVYGCGGFGVNMVRNHVNLNESHDNPMYPIVSIHAIDTSDSNLGESQNNIDHHIVPGVDGAGKNRQKAYDATSPYIVPILNDHKPGNFNIVIFSTSGGKQV